MRDSLDIVEQLNKNAPIDVKAMNKKELALLCREIRKRIIETTSINGGHLSSNLGDVELTIAIHRAFSFPTDKLVFDVGHQAYTHKILTGRSLKNIGGIDATSRFSDTSESVFDPSDAGHSSTSLSIAQGFAIARDLKGEKYDVVAVIGDASIANGLSFEALNSIGNRQNKVIVVLNDNDMSISAPSGALGNFFRKISTDRLYNKAKIHYRSVLAKTKFGRFIYRVSLSFKNGVKRILVPMTLFETLGFTYIGPIDGHDIKAIEKALKRAKNTTKSVVLHLSTTKGKGYSFAEKDKDGVYHSVEPFDIDTGLPKDAHDGKVSFPAIFGELTYGAMKENEGNVLIAAAMMKGSRLEKSFEDFSSRSFDVGIAEEHAITLASSLALAGYHPIVSMYSTFLQRGYDELLHDCARKNIDMTLIIDRAGLSGRDGETHAGIYDVAFLKTIPNVKVSMPSCFSEAKFLFDESLGKGKGIMAIRYPNAFIDKDAVIKDEEIHYEEGYSIYKKGNGESLLLAVGPDGRKLCDEISENFDGKIIIPLRLSEISEPLFKEIVQAKKLYIFDRYSTVDGFVKTVETSLFENGVKIDCFSFALPKAFVPHGSKNDQATLFKLDFQTVIDKIIESEKSTKQM